ncbi:hypothetical protein D3C86_1392240 [compost metagenome]
MDSDLARHGIVAGHACALRFASGVNVEGRVRYVRREGGRIVLIGFDACTVTFQGETLFQPEWGVYDMAVGERITSVAAAYPDVRYPLVAPRTDRKVTSEATLDPRLAGLHALYARVRSLREEPQDLAMTDKALTEIVEALDQAYPEDWLLRLEVLELLTRDDRVSQLQAHLRASLAAQMTTPDRRELIENGLALLPPARTMA